MKTIYTVIIMQIFGGVEEVYHFNDKTSADAFVLDWCNGGNTMSESLCFATAEEGIEWFKTNQEKVDFMISLVEIPVAFTRDDFMAFFRSDTFHESISVDDAREVFSSVLHGKSDLTKAMLTVMANSYEADVLDLYSAMELLNAIRRRAKDEGVITSESSLWLMALESSKGSTKDALSKCLGVDVGNENYYIDPEYYQGGTELDEFVKKANEFGGIGLIKVY